MTLESLSQNLSPQLLAESFALLQQTWILPVKSKWRIGKTLIFAAENPKFAGDIPFVYPLVI